MGALENGSIKSNNKVRSLSKICFILFSTEELAALNICSKKLGHVSFHFHPYFRKQECFFWLNPHKKMVGGANWAKQAYIGPEITFFTIFLSLVH